MLRFTVVLAFVGCALAQNPTVPPSEFNCADYPAGDAYYPSPTSCDEFYRCGVPGYTEAFKYTCPAGQVYYDPNTRCEFEYSVPPPCGTATTATGGPVNTIDPTPQHLCDGKNQGTFPVKDCCTKFYSCSGITEPETTTAQNCPSGLVYNKTHGYCDWPANVPECEDSNCIY
uniref:peritrophin-1-like n=1 Tax=Styela clava TaxID=7725 RepID=UPI001939CC99|nr:peritrophin-1-like [Styela clava]